MHGHHIICIEMARLDHKQLQPFCILETPKAGTFLNSKQQVKCSISSGSTLFVKIKRILRQKIQYCFNKKLTLHS